MPNDFSVAGISSFEFTHDDPQRIHCQHWTQRSLSRHNLHRLHLIKTLSWHFKRIFSGVLENHRTYKAACFNETFPLLAISNTVSHNGIFIIQRIAITVLRL